MRILGVILISLSIFGACSTPAARSEFGFANKMAAAGLWKEAYFRWQKILPNHKDHAALHNNMAIALEEMGQKDEAEKEYQLAMKLAPKNTYIETNYKRFKESLTRKEDFPEKKGKKRRKWKKQNEK